MDKSGNENGNEKKQGSLNPDEIEQIKDFGSITKQGSGHTIHCLAVIGQIEGHYILSNNEKTTKYEHVLPQLAAIEESRDIHGLLIMLNTMGGDVEAGLAIAELIAGMKTPTVSLVLGGGHSIGVPLAVAAMHSFIAPSAAMTIHPVRMVGRLWVSPRPITILKKYRNGL